MTSWDVLRHTPARVCGIDVPDTRWITNRLLDLRWEYHKVHCAERQTRPHVTTLTTMVAAKTHKDTTKSKAKQPSKKKRAHNDVGFLNNQAFYQLLQSGSKRVTPFQKTVLAALCRVPPGQVTTYKLLADVVKCNSCQAVGQALRRNPYAPTVPCHRVVAHNGSLCGFGGVRSGAKLDAKRELLQSEGVRFLDQGTVDPSCIYRFDENGVPDVYQKSR